MTFRILLIASAAMICLCTADVSHINQKTPQDILVPFNDLLPPPAEESTTEQTTTTTTTTTRATPSPTTTLVTKPTKKSYYQQQQQQQGRSKDIQQGSAAPELQLTLDLLPPFAESPSNDSLEPQGDEEVHTTTHRPLVSSLPTATARSIMPHVARPEQLHARVARPNSIASDTPASTHYHPHSQSHYHPDSHSSSQGVLTPDLIAQYATYFQFTTHRPLRGPLPTLRPFSNSVKK